MAYGGLRGAVVLEKCVWYRELFITTALFMVFFTVFLQGGTIKLFVKLFRATWWRMWCRRLRMWLEDRELRVCYQKYAELETCSWKEFLSVKIDSNIFNKSLREFARVSKSPTCMLLELSPIRILRARQKSRQEQFLFLNQESHSRKGWEHLTGNHTRRNHLRILIMLRAKKLFKTEKLKRAYTKNFFLFSSDFLCIMKIESGNGKCIYNDIYLSHKHCMKYVQNGTP